MVTSPANYQFCTLSVTRSRQVPLHVPLRRPKRAEFPSRSLFVTAPPPRSGFEQCRGGGWLPRQRRAGLLPACLLKAKAADRRGWSCFPRLHTRPKGPVLPSAASRCMASMAAAAGSSSSAVDSCAMDSTHVTLWSMAARHSRSGPHLHCMQVPRTASTAAASPNASGQRVGSRRCTQHSSQRRRM